MNKTKIISLVTKSVKYLLAAILVIVPLLPKFPLFRIPGIYVAIRFEDILMLILGLQIAIIWILNSKEIFKDKIIQAILLFILCGFISLLTGAFTLKTLTFNIGLLHWARRIEYILPFLAVLTILPKKDISLNINFFVKILVIVVLIAFSYGIGQRYFGFPVIITQNEQYSKGVALKWTPGSHINSTFAGHYDLAAFIVMVMPILLLSIFVLRKNMDKLLMLMSSGAGIWLLINSVSRMAQLSYLTAITVAFLSIKKLKALVLVLIISLALMFSSSGLDARFTRAIEVIYQRITQGKAITDIGSRLVVKAYEVSVSERGTGVINLPTPKPALSDVSIAIRLNVEWPRAIRAFLKNPILGTGYSSVGLAIDNDILRILAETGLLGLASFILIFLQIGKVLTKVNVSKLEGLDKTFILGFIGSLAGVFLTSLFIDIFEASKFAIIFWLLMGLVVVLGREKNDK